MKNPASYFIQQNGAEKGPYTTAQINRMKQKGEIAADTPCRREHETSFRRVDAVFPHLKEQKVDFDKVARVKKDVTDYEIKSLIAIAVAGTIAIATPRATGTIGALTTLGCGLALLIRHRKPVGFLAIAAGIGGLYIHYQRSAHRFGV